ncbi:AraC family transcriptional regulator [Paenibacillus oralis]|uniref:AraC family transcriptional regulator n=1 Tax=Paenibacillus oralis TaxID=2490856 RepID=A0A3P3U9L2_9BACL|nr:AraC family transcriptional regulator [Paenibacillus oralis]
MSAYLKKHLNKTYIEIIQEIRLKKSYALLVNTSKPIEKISSEVGYSNTYYFSNLFKKKYGQTPSYIRREVRQNP